MRRPGRHDPVRPARVVHARHRHAVPGPDSELLGDGREALRQLRVAPGDDRRRGARVARGALEVDRAVGGFFVCLIWAFCFGKKESE